MMMSLATSISQGQERDSRAPFLPTDWPHREHSQFPVSSGCRWHVQRMGQGPCLLMIHGTAASTHTWRDVMPILARHFDVIAVDLPGHAYTERLPTGSMTLQSLSTAVAELLLTLGARPQHLVGHSAGAAIALDLALHRDVAAESVIGVNAALLPFGGVMKDLFSPMARFFATTKLMPRMLARRARNTKAVNRVLDGTGSRLSTVGLSYYQRLFQAETHLASVLEMMATWQLQPLIHDLPELAAQLTLIVGTEDKAVSPREALKIRELLPDLRIEELDGLGHLAHEESPETVAGLIKSQVQRT
ncbi:MAG: alpha/beta fold hydrolase BchO [Pseudomonadota bacterium]